MSEAGFHGVFPYVVSPVMESGEVNAHGIRATPYIILGEPGIKIGLWYWRRYCLMKSQFPE
jgi:hypothetical protein